MRLTRQILGFDLPNFTGDSKEWPSFITTYNRTTKDCDFSASENMERLRKCLSGPAQGCVKMILLTNNVERAVKILQRNYGNSGIIFEQLMNDVK
jgi:hypothetical protein